MEQQLRAMRIHRPGGPDGLVLDEAPEPFAATGDVIVQVTASSFVPDELEWPSTWTDRAGKNRTPSIPGHEVAGVVSHVPYGTAGFAVGDRVFGLTDWHRDGTAAEYIAVEARNLAHVPDDVDDVRAAALPLAGLTAWQGLFVHGGLTAGQTVVVHGAVGGTGAIAVQLAVDAGAHVIGTGRARHAELASRLGCHEFIDLEGDGLGSLRAVDFVFDTVGGAVLERSASLVAPGGSVISITAPPVVAADVNGVFFIVEPDRDQLRRLAELVHSRRLTPHVGAVVTLDELPQAFAAKRSGVPGKIVVRM